MQQKSSLTKNAFLISEVISIQRGSVKVASRKRLYNFDPLKSHFYIVKLGFTGVYIIFLISAQRHRLWVLVRDGSNEYTIYVLSRNMKNVRIFCLKTFHFLVVKCSVFLKRHVFVMEIQNKSKTENSRLSLVEPVHVE